MGFSGARLVDALGKIGNPGRRLTAAIGEYEELFKFRNRLSTAAGLSTVLTRSTASMPPLEKGVPRMSWYVTSYSNFESMFGRWTKLSQVADDLIGEAMGGIPPPYEPRTVLCRWRRLRTGSLSGPVLERASAGLGIVTAEPRSLAV